MWTCSYCGRENASELATCPQCGKAPETTEKPARRRPAPVATEPALAEADAWNQTIFDWLTHIVDESGGTYKASESEHFVMLSSFAAESAASALRSAESALKTIGASLGPAADARFLGKHALIVLRDQDDYNKYIAQYFPDKPLPDVAGALTPLAYTHISLSQTGDRLDLRDLANELSHNLLAHLPLPRWLMEGLAIVLTRRVTRHPFAFDPASGEEHREVWNTNNIQAFWSGEAFDTPGLASRAYELADILVTLLAGKGIELIGFIIAANKRDAGESASKAHLGFSFGDLAAEFLGSGEWTPAPVGVSGDKP